jgi:hypothetical protein
VDSTKPKLLTPMGSDSSNRQSAGNKPGNVDILSSLDINQRIVPATAVSASSPSKGGGYKGGEGGTSDSTSHSDGDSSLQQSLEAPGYVIEYAIVGNDKRVCMFICVCVRLCVCIFE